MPIVYFLKQAVILYILGLVLPHLKKNFVHTHIVF